jgi:membrane protease YdiL (CAAX protease family)
MRERKSAAGPFAEAAFVLAVFYISVFLPFAPHVNATSFTSLAFYAGLIATEILRILFLLVVMSTGDGLAAFGIGRFRFPDLLKALLVALGAFAVILPPSFLFTAFGLVNPMLAGLKHGSRETLALIPLFLASSMSTGYAEELFFRSYLMRRLEQAGLKPVWSAIASSLLFGGAHGAQGLVGILSTSLVGLWFAWRWHKGRDIHKIAIGHGLYDAAVFAIALYA